MSHKCSTISVISYFRYYIHGRVSNRDFSKMNTLRSFSIQLWGVRLRYLVSKHIAYCSSRWNTADFEMCGLAYQWVDNKLLFVDYVKYYIGEKYS